MHISHNKTYTLKIFNNLRVLAHQPLYLDLHGLVLGLKIQIGSSSDVCQSTCLVYKDKIYCIPSMPRLQYFFETISCIQETKLHEVCNYHSKLKNFLL